jgi:hypothetical protein
MSPRSTAYSAAVAALSSRHSRNRRINMFGGPSRGCGLASVETSAACGWSDADLPKNPRLPNASRQNRGAEKPQRSGTLRPRRDPGPDPNDST